MKRTPLKRKTPLKRTALKSSKGLRIVSKKQAAKNRVWSEIKKNRIEFLAAKYGAPICEYCGKHVLLGTLDAHHIDEDRNNNTPENCYICHRFCHSHITDNNIKVQQLDFQGMAQNVIRNGAKGIDS
jgi:hypothetical protein